MGRPKQDNKAPVSYEAIEQTLENISQRLGAYIKSAYERPSKIGLPFE